MVDECHWKVVVVTVHRESIKGQCRATEYLEWRIGLHSTSYKQWGFRVESLISEGSDVVHEFSTHDHDIRIREASL